MFSKKAVTSISSSGQRRLWSASECQRWPRVGAGLCWRRGRAWPAGERLSAEAPERDPGHRRPQLKGEAGAGVLRPPTRPSGLRGGTALLAGTPEILLEQIPVSPGCASLPSHEAGCPAPAPRRSWGDMCTCPRSDPLRMAISRGLCPLARLAAASSLCAALGAPAAIPSVPPCGQRP